MAAASLSRQLMQLPDADSQLPDGHDGGDVMMVSGGDVSGDGDVGDGRGDGGDGGDSEW